MSIMQRVRSAFRGMAARNSGWKFEGEDGAALDVGTPFAKLGVGLGGGLVTVKRTSDSRQFRLRYAKAGLSVGLGLIPTPVNFSFSLPIDQLSWGVIYKMPMAGRTLSLSEITGNFMIVELQGDFRVGYGVSMMFTDVFLPPVIIPSLTIPAMMLSARSCAVFGGASATVVPGNVGAAVMFGRLWQ